MRKDNGSYLIEIQILSTVQYNKEGAKEMKLKP
jgi:hypothetical protein